MLLMDTCKASGSGVSVKTPCRITVEDTKIWFRPPTLIFEDSYHLGVYIRPYIGHIWVPTPYNYTRKVFPPVDNLTHGTVPLNNHGSKLWEQNNHFFIIEITILKVLPSIRAWVSPKIGKNWSENVKIGQNWTKN